MFDRNLAILLAKLSSLAYVQKSNHNEFLKQLSSLKYSLIGEIQTKTEPIGFVAQNLEKAILIFRGTASLLDFLEDIEFIQVPFENNHWWQIWKPMCHNGFMEFYESCKSQIEALLNKITLPLYISGHSLGGAIGSIAAIDIAKKYNPVVYTFGAPRIGNKRFVKKLSKITKENWRVLNVYDVITRIPPEPYYAHSPQSFSICFGKPELNAKTILSNHSVDGYLESLTKTTPFF